MRLKSTVKFGNNIMAVCTAMTIIDSIYRSYGYECVITSINDSKHGTKSLHYKNSAFDVRTRSILYEEQKERILTTIKESLTEDFDVLYEGKGTDNQHFHIEYQPK